MAASKTDAQVIIGGKVYTLSGYESEEYIQKIASYLNGKLEEFRAEPGYSHLSTDLQKILMDINLADDYFRAKKQIEVLSEEIRSKEKDLYDIKHELVTTQMKMANNDKAMKKLEEEAEELRRKVVDFETSRRSGN